MYVSFFEKLPNYFPETLYHFTFGPAGYKISIFLHPGQYLVLSRFLIVLAGVLWYITLFLIYVSLMASDFEHLFLCLCCHLYILFMKCLVFCPFSHSVICFLLLSFGRPLYILGLSPSSDTWSANVFFQSVACLYVFLAESATEENF